MTNKSKRDCVGRWAVVSPVEGEGAESAQCLMDGNFVI